VKFRFDSEYRVRQPLLYFQLIGSSEQRRSRQRGCLFETPPFENPHGGSTDPVLSPSNLAQTSLLMNHTKSEERKLLSQIPTGSDAFHAPNSPGYIALTIHEIFHTSCGLSPFEHQCVTLGAETLPRPSYEYIWPRRAAEIHERTLPTSQPATVLDARQVSPIQFAIF
jgi:hypothetical protein